MKRRGFLALLLCGTAFAVMPSVALANADPVQPIEAWLGRAARTTAGVASNDPRLPAYYAAASGKLNGYAGGTGASWLRTFGKIAFAVPRLAGKVIFGRVGTAITVIGTVFTVGATLWGWHEQQQAERSFIEACPVGGSCRVANGSGGNDWYTHTRERASSASSWSLSGTNGNGNWAHVKQVAAPAPPPGVPALYTWDVWWKYIGSGTYDPAFAIPNQGTVTTANGLNPQNIEDLLRERGEQTALDPVLAASIVNALNDLILADAATSDEVRQIAQLIAANPATASTSANTGSQVARVSDLVGTTPAGRPVAITDAAPGTVPGDQPTPSPSPSPSPSPTVAPPLDWGPVPPPPALDVGVWDDWLPNPFSVPNLSGTCTNLTIPGGSVFNVTIPATEVDFCSYLLEPTIRTIVSTSTLLGYTVYAGTILLDV